MKAQSGGLERGRRHVIANEIAQRVVLGDEAVRNGQLRADGKIRATATKQTNS